MEITANITEDHLCCDVPGNAWKVWPFHGMICSNMNPGARITAGLAFISFYLTT